jgi:VCBS repeat-containing protein
VAEDGPLTTGGKLTITDVDSGENHFQAVAPASLIGKYGTFTFDTNTGEWGYTLNNAAAETLPTGQVVHDTLTVKSADGSAPREIDVSITSTNDAPIIQGGVEAHQPNIANDKGLLVFDGQFFFGDDTLTVSDPDGLQFGIAIVDLDNAAGLWEYQLGGVGEWLPIPEVPDGMAFVLSATDKVRFTGPAKDAAEMLHFKAWDGTDSSIHGTTVPLPSVPGGSTAFSIGTYTVGAKNNGPAGIAGEPINLGLADPSLVGHTVTVTINDLASDWIINGGTHNADGSWTVQTTDVGSLSVTTSSSFVGAMLVTVTETVVQADGTTTTFRLGDNIEAYSQGSPIFAWSGDDFLTASSGKDLLVFSQAIGHDTVYSFDAAADQIDLIGYADFTSFADVQAHLGEDAAGNAVIAVGTGQSITLQGVDQATLTENNFVFDQTATLENAGTMTIGDGAILPLSGTIHNTGVIALNSTGDETDLQLIENGLTLDGGGQIVLSDSDANVISGTSASVTLNNEDNTISGAGQLGNGELSLTNAGTIDATGIHQLTIDTGSNIVFNSGTLEASGAGGLTVASSIANSGVLWANASYLTVQREVSGSGIAKIDGAGTIDFEASSTANVVFGSGAAGTLKLGDAFHFNGTISGFTGSDTIDLADVSSATASLNYSENAAGGGGTLTISDGSQSLELSLVGAYSADNFSLVSDQAKGTLVSYVPHDLIV